jgi:hypothetical protein
MRTVCRRLSSVALVLLAAGCGHAHVANTTPPQPPSAPAITGARVAASGFSVVVPAGWTNVTDRTLCKWELCLKKTPTSQPNSGIIVSSLGHHAAPVEAVADIVKSNAKDNGETILNGGATKARPLGNEKAIGFVQDLPSSQSRDERLVVLHRGNAYQIDVLLPYAQAAEDQPITDAILNTWKWSS